MSDGAAGSDDPIDRRIEGQLSELGGDRLLERLWRLFLELAPGRLEQLERRLEAGDGTGVAELAHLIRSSSLALGASEISRHAAEIERLADDPEGQRRETPRLAEAHVRIYRYLERRLAELQAGRPTKL